MPRPGDATDLKQFINVFDRWTVRGEPVTPNDHMRLLPEGSLLIHQVSCDDAGEYTCHVENPYDQDTITHTQHTARSAQHAAHSTQHTAQSTQHILHIQTHTHTRNTLHTHSTLYTQNTQYTY